jgi:CubicO group peptidase (beta-lactamase class C family)
LRRLNQRHHLAMALAAMLLLLASLAGCVPSIEDLEAVSYEPIAGADWEVSTPEAQGLDPMLVAHLYYEAAQMETLYSLLVIKNGYLIAEGYYNGKSIEQKFRLQSATKSFTSALVGIAIDQGLPTSVDQKMVDFFPEVVDDITDPRKMQITLQQLLQMRAGFPWEESHPDLWAGLLSGRYVPLIQGFPLVANPGTEYHYSNLTSNWLGIIVSRVAGTTMKSFAEEHLFSPLGIEPGEWGTDAEGHNNGCGDLHLTARDAAKFGLLYLNDGVYDGTQVVSADWVQASLQSYTQDAFSEVAGKKIGRHFRDIGYGYQWWSATVGDYHVDYAAGHGGQLIVIIDELELVIVTIADPFYLVHTGESWRNEKACFNLVGGFVDSLPSE